MTAWRKHIRKAKVTGALVASFAAAAAGSLAFGYLAARIIGPEKTIQTLIDRNDRTLLRLYKATGEVKSWQLARALHHAIYTDNEKMVRWLVQEQGVSVDADFSGFDRREETALMIAVIARKPQMRDLLLSLRANPAHEVKREINEEFDPDDYGGISRRLSISEKSAYDAAITYEDADSVRAFIKTGMPVTLDMLRRQSIPPAIMDALLKGYYEQRGRKCKIDFNDMDRIIPEAILSGDFDEIEVISALSIDLSRFREVDIDGHKEMVTPLMLAAYAGDEKIGRFLLDEGVDALAFNEGSKFDHTALEVAVLQGRFSFARMMVDEYKIPVTRASIAWSVAVTGEASEMTAYLRDRYMKQNMRIVGNPPIFGL